MAGLQLRRVASDSEKTTAMELGDDMTTATATSNSEKTRSDNSGQGEATTAVRAKRQQTTTEWSEATQRCATAVYNIPGNALVVLVGGFALSSSAFVLKLLKDRSQLATQFGKAKWQQHILPIFHRTHQHRYKRS
jgi:hypothetical protein